MIRIGPPTPFLRLAGGHLIGDVTIDPNKTIDGIDLSARYDTDWFPVVLDTVYPAAHGLGAVPFIVQAWYSNTSDGSGDVVAICGSGTFGAPTQTSIIIEVDATNLKIRTGSVNIVHYFDVGGTERYPTTGWLKMIAVK